MILDFPPNPVNGAEYSANGVSYVFQSPPGMWKAESSGGGGGGGGTTTGGGTDQVFQENEMICHASYELTAGRSALSAGPVTIQDGVEIVIPDNQSWVIL